MPSHQVRSRKGSMLQKNTRSGHFSLPGRVSNSGSTTTLATQDTGALSMREKKKQLQAKYKAWAKAKDADSRMVDNIAVRPVSFRMPFEAYLISVCAGLSCVFAGYFPKTFQDVNQHVVYQFEETPETQQLLFNLMKITAFLGYMLAAVLGDLVGRRSCIIACAVIIGTASFLSCIAENLVLIYLGIFVCTLAFGVTEVNALAYIIECSASSNRGTTILAHTFARYCGHVCYIALKSFFIDNSNEFQWRAKMAFVCILMIPQLIFAIPLPDSPKRSMIVGNKRAAYNSLRRLRQVRFLAIREYAAIDYMYYIEWNHTNPWKKFKKMMSVSNIRRSFFVVAGVIALDPWGFRVTKIAEHVTVLKAMSPLGGPEEAGDRLVLLIYSVSGVLMIALFWVPDVLGRRLTLIAGYVGMLCGLLLWTAAVYNNRDNSPPASRDYLQNTSFADECNKYRSCFECTLKDYSSDDDNNDNNNNAKCGFCAREVDDGATVMGSCVTIRTKKYRKYSKEWFHNELNPTKSAFADKGQCSFEEHQNRSAANDTSRPVFTMWYKSCPSRFYASIFALVVLETSIFTFVFRTLFTYLAEIPPQWIRTMFIALCLAFYVVNALFREIVESLLLDKLPIYKQQIINMAQCVLAVVFVWFKVPETRGRELEFTDLLFMKRSKRRELAKIRARRINERVLVFHPPQ